MASRGLPSINGALIPPAAVESPDEPAEEPGTAEGEPQKGRRRRAAARATRTRGHKLTLSDALFARLQLTAIKRGSTVSAVAAAMLDKHLPQLRIEGE